MLASAEIARLLVASLSATLFAPQLSLAQTAASGAPPPAYAEFKSRLALTPGTNQQLTEVSTVPFIVERRAGIIASLSILPPADYRHFGIFLTIRNQGAAGVDFDADKIEIRSGSKILKQLDMAQLIATERKKLDRKETAVTALGALSMFASALGGGYTQQSGSINVVGSDSTVYTGNYSGRSYDPEKAQAAVASAEAGAKEMLASTHASNEPKRQFLNVLEFRVVRDQFIAPGQAAPMFGIAEMPRSRGKSVPIELNIEIAGEPFRFVATILPSN